MKLRSERYTPKKRRNPLLMITTVFLVVLIVTMWLNMDRFDMETSDAMIATGLGLIIVSVALSNSKKEKQIRISDKELEEMRDKIGKDEYTTSSMFFDDNGKD